MPMQFDDYMIKVTIDEDYAGRRVLEEAEKRWNHGIDRAPEFVGRPSVEIDYLSGTREIERAVVTFEHPSGRVTRVVNTPLRTVYLKAGSGYVHQPDWGHGVYQGELKVEGKVYDLSTPEKRKEWAFLNETLCRFELDTGEVGWGMHENLCVGVYEPNGFMTGDAVAP